MNILAVDDEIFALEAIAKELEIMFPKACLQKEQRASKALEWAKELAEKGEILSYAFLDIQIRGLNGLELAQQLKFIIRMWYYFFVPLTVNMHMMHLLYAQKDIC